MSTQQQEYSVSAGISMFNGHKAPNTNSNSQSNQGQPPTVSNKSEPSKNAYTAPGSASPSNVKLVGSNRFFIPNKK